jgi:hypothetical protein
MPILLMLDVTLVQGLKELVWRTNVVRKSLVAFDTDHIKSYVFGTDRLKEIRGASALLDDLNRKEMLRIAKEFYSKDKMRDIYLNGGSGLFLLMVGKEEAHEFGKHVRKGFEEATRGGASVTYVVHELPDRLSEDSEPLPDDVDRLMGENLSSQFDILRYRLREAKSNPPDHQTITLPSHPFLRPCDSCGMNYAEHKVAGYGDHNLWRGGISIISRCLASVMPPKR